MEGEKTGARHDVVEFTVSEPGLTQVMIGAVHFSGRGGGAEIRSIAVKSIPAGAKRSSKPKAPVAPRGGYAGQAHALAIKDHERQMRSYAHARSADGVSGARARMIFHAHAIEKGLTGATSAPDSERSRYQASPRR